MSRVTARAAFSFGFDLATLANEIECAAITDRETAWLSLLCERDFDALRVVLVASARGMTLSQFLTYLETPSLVHVFQKHGQSDGDARAFLKLLGLTFCYLRQDGHPKPH